MPASDLDQTLLRVLLEQQLDKFERNLASENPGLSESERERYMRAARAFVNQILGSSPRTRGRKARPAKRPPTVG
ncbi:MAG TPA: hypothetical protein VEC57_08515 [Candidatus Limnocylindrales bacterium]|nr:hypothetical protein [Candidatus Limnocylindrales bacterium]